MPVQVDQDVSRKLIQFPLTPGVRVERLPKPGATEIAEQEQALIEVAREDLRGAQADMKQAIRQRR